MLWKDQQDGPPLLRLTKDKKREMIPITNIIGMLCQNTSSRSSLCPQGGMDSRKVLAISLQLFSRRLKTCSSIVLHIWLPVPGIAKQLLPLYLFSCLSRDPFCAYLRKPEDLSSFLVLCLYSVVVFSFASDFKAGTKENEDNFYSIEWSSGLLCL